MLLVRRSAPEGSYFEDGDRAAGVFGVLATGFAVLIGFVVFLSFESYDTSRSGAETEARSSRSSSRRCSSCRSRCAVGSPASSSATPARSSTRMAGDESRIDWRHGQPVGRGDLPDARRRSSRDRVRADGLRQVVRRAIGPGGRRADRVHGAAGVIPRRSGSSSSSARGSSARSCSCSPTAASARSCRRS